MSPRDMTGGQAPDVAVPAIVLAAGAATRFGSPKQRLLLPRVLARLAEAPVGEVVVVAGAYPLELEGARVVACPDWELGPGASLRCGLAALPPDAEAAVVVLADGPELAPEAVGRVLAAQQETGAPLVAASYAGGRGHPLVVARELWERGAGRRPARLRPAARPLRRPRRPGDVDRPEDLS